MIALGLTSAELLLFNQSLTTHHSIRVTVQILDLNHKYLADLTANLIDGQVNIDADAENTRQLTMQLRDVDSQLQLDSRSPADGALFFDRMVRVVYSVKSELLPRWVDVPIFCGPITKMSRTADFINLEAMGKESLTMPPALAYFSKSWPKGVKRTELITAIMYNYGGETRFSIPVTGETTPGPISMVAETNMWALAKAVSGGGTQLYYDGRGVLCRRTLPKTAAWTFKTGQGGNILTPPAIDYDISEVRNMVRVKGAVPQGKTAPVTADVALPKTHPLNSAPLGRNGKHRVLFEIVEDDNVKTVEQARALATSRVNSLALQGVEVKFDAIVAPHLEPEDIYVLQTSDFAMLVRYRQATIPLKSSVSSVGYLTKRALNKTGVRR